MPNWFYASKMYNRFVVIIFRVFFSIYFCFDQLFITLCPFHSVDTLGDTNLSSKKGENP